MTRISVHLLGAPAIARDGETVSVDTRKATALLAVLAVSGRPHTREALAALLWPEYDDDHARSALRRTLSTLRSALGQSALTTDRDAVALTLGAGDWVDVAAFRAALAGCRSHGHPPGEVCTACVPLLQGAANLYRDDFMAGFTLRDSVEFDEWQSAQAETLRSELAVALDRLATAHAAAEEFDAGLVAARRWLLLDPLREEAHRRVMQLNGWAGRRNAAMQQCRDCVRILERELGVAPLPETTALYEAIRAGRHAPGPPRGKGEWRDETEGAWPVSTATMGADAAPAGDTGLSRAVPARAPHAGAGLASAMAGLGAERDAAQGEAKPAGAAQSQETLVSRGALPLVGRSAELAWLVRAFERHAASGYFAALTGEAGIGKTRLAEEFLAQARVRGARAIAVRCYEGEAGVAYAPIAQAMRQAMAPDRCGDPISPVPAHWLAEAARLLPELHVLHPGLPTPPPLDAPGAQSRLFEGLSQLLVAACGRSSPAVLCFDDLQWADSASLDLLAYIVRRLGDRPAFVLDAWRSVEGPAGAGLRRLLAEAERAGNGASVHLERLALADVMAVVRLLDEGGAGLPDGIGGRLFHESEGLPLFLAAYVEALAGQAPAPAAGAWPLPHGVADLLRSRLDVLDGATLQAVQAAAVIGRSFDPETLGAVAGRTSEEVVGALEALAGQELIREVAGEAAARPHYDFSHEKLRELVYQDTSLARRRLLHGRAARAAEQPRPARSQGAAAGPIARHYRLAGQDAEAAAWYAVAGDHARSLYANAEALGLYADALASGHPDTCRLSEAIADVQTLLGDYGAALRAYEAAAALCEPGSATLARVEHRLGLVHSRRGDWQAAGSHFEAALACLAGTGDAAPPDGSAGRILADWSLAAHALGQPDRASELARDALVAAGAANDRASVAQAHNILGILARGGGDHRGAMAQLRRSLDIAETLQDPGIRIAALNNLALALADGEEHEEALAAAREALELCVAVGDRHREAAQHNNLADLLHAAGREEEAMAHLKQAVVIFAQVGGAGEIAQPEVWKLSEW